MAGTKFLKSAAVLPLSRRLLGFLPSRSYGSAAALQFDYDYSDDEYYSGDEALNRGQRVDSVPVESSERSVSGRGVQWVIMGEPAAKKRFYAAKLSKLLGVPHISMGPLLRQELLHPNSSVYHQIANAVNHRELVPESIIFQLLSNRLEDGYHRGETGFILDGIPRTRIQAETLDRIADIDLVLNFKCLDEKLMKRPFVVGGDFPVFSKVESMNNSMSNSNLQPRNDKLKSSNSDCDDEFCIYEEIKSLEDYYKNQKKLLNFQVASAPGETWQGLLAALHLQHMDALSSSNTLTA